MAEDVVHEPYNLTTHGYEPQQQTTSAFSNNAATVSQSAGRQDELPAFEHFPKQHSLDIPELPGEVYAANSTGRSTGTGKHQDTEHSQGMLCTSFGT